MLSIYKYKIESYDQLVSAPVINWLHVDFQGWEDCYVAWALVDLDAKERLFNIKLLTTGEEVRDTELKGYQHLGTVNKNTFVAHFFVAELNPETKKVMIDDTVFWDPDISWLNNVEVEYVQ